MQKQIIKMANAKRKKAAKGKIPAMIRNISKWK